VADLVHEWRQPTPYRWQILGVSVAATFAMMVVFIPESQRADQRKPKVTWISTFGEKRTLTQIKASNLANQQRQDKIRAENAQIEEKRKELYRQLGRATFIDVDAMERKLQRDKAAEEAASAKARAQVQATVEQR
jgi:hypothetical protein